MKHTAELLMPAGSLEKLKVAILYGPTPSTWERRTCRCARGRTFRSTTFWKASPSPTLMASASLSTCSRTIAISRNCRNTFKPFARPARTKSSSRTPASSITSSKPRLSWSFISRRRPMCVRGFRVNSGRTRREAHRPRAGSVVRGVEGDPREVPRHQARSVYPRRNVHDLLGALPLVELHDGAWRESGQLREFLPVELQAQGALERRVAERHRAE